MKNCLRQIFVLSLGVMLVAVATLSSEAAQRPAPLTHLRWTLERVDHHTLWRLRSGLSLCRAHPGGPSNQ